MKRNTFVLYTMLSLAFVISSVLSVEMLKSKSRHSHDRAISKSLFNTSGPNLADINRLVKPLIKSPYRPEEVDSLYNSNKSEDSLEMANAEIVGPSGNKAGLIEVDI